MADETSDCGHTEQVGFVIRYFDENENTPLHVYMFTKIRVY